MKKNYKPQIIAGLLALFTVTHASAENRPGAFTITLADAYYHFAQSRHFDNTSLPNIALAYDMTDRWAIEGGVGVVNTNQKPSAGGAGVHGFLYTADAIYRCFKYKQLEPYVIGGIGLLALNRNGLNSTHQGNINAGIGTQLFFSDMIALRAEARDLYTTTGGGKNDYMINFGVSFLIGG